MLPLILSLRSRNACNKAEAMSYLHASCYSTAFHCIDFYMSCGGNLLLSYAGLYYCSAIVLPDASCNRKLEHVASTNAVATIPLHVAYACTS